MANTLTISSALMCPHGGSVSIVSANTRVSAGGSAVALVSDTFSISGCPFQRPLPGGAQPSPCVTVQWLVTDLRVNVQGRRTLSSASQGLCLAADQVPQGAVVVQSTQAKASST
jgi:hypothetical protein